MPDRSTTPIPAHPDVVIESDTRVWAGRFPLDVVKFRQRRFDGVMSGTRTWELWRRGRASALIPYDPWTDAVVLIEQFRLPALAAGLDPVLVELPAGLCDDGEEPAATILREMQEEMRMNADRLEPGQRCAQAEVTAAGPERLVLGIAAHVEAVRIRV